MKFTIPVALLAALSAALSIALATAPAAKTPRDAPDITAEHWLNSPPLDRADLRGKVVLVEFWTFACWNCKNVEPYMRTWHDRYAEAGLVVVAVHTPELSYERDLDNVREYLAKNEIEYPVAVDNDFSTWKAFGNWAWPTMYLVNRDGQIVHTRVGEGGYAETEARIRELLGKT